MMHIHLVGIGGFGLSAIARILLESGYSVSGSDMILSPQTRELTASGAVIYKGHDAINISGADLVIRSSAIPENNPEIQAAYHASIPVQKRAEFLDIFINQAQDGSQRFPIAIAGTHGKTTTTAMITWLLVSLNQDPSYIIGGISKNLKRNAHAGSGRHFVIEADEYDYMFHGLHPKITVITNIEYDHPDCFPSVTDYQQAFIDFIRNTQPGGVKVICIDDQGTRNAIAAANGPGKTRSYGASTDAQYCCRNISLNQHGCNNFEMWTCDGAENGKSDKLADVVLKVPGEHNVLNATAALAVIHLLGLSVEEASKALTDFCGTERRFDIQGEVLGITVIDDYAHHPVEIQTTLKAARSRFPGSRIWAVWQPHTYSRIKLLFDDFTRAFDSADSVIVTEIYAAREKQMTFSAEQIVNAMQHPNVRFIPSLDSTKEYLLNNLTAGDILLVLSAGDAIEVSSNILSGLKERRTAGVHPTRLTHPSNETGDHHGK